MVKGPLVRSASSTAAISIGFSVLLRYDARTRDSQNSKYGYAKKVNWSFEIPSVARYELLKSPINRMVSVQTYWFYERAHQNARGCASRQFED